MRVRSVSSAQQQLPKPFCKPRSPQAVGYSEYRDAYPDTAYAGLTDGYREEGSLDPSLYLDRSGHRRAVHRAMIRVCTYGGERSGVGSRRLCRGASTVIERDAMADAAIPRPGHSCANRDCRRRWREVVVSDAHGISGVAGGRCARGTGAAIARAAAASRCSHRCHQYNHHAWCTHSRTFRQRTKKRMSERR